MKKKYCSWCGKPTIMSSLQLADTPILEFMEDKISALGRDELWGEKADWSTLDLDSELEAELLVYDSMLSSVSQKTVCISCLEQDDKLFNKYYNK
jgi:hypothetical protein